MTFCDRRRWHLLTFVNKRGWHLLTIVWWQVVDIYNWHLLTSVVDIYWHLSYDRGLKFLKLVDRCGWHLLTGGWHLTFVDRWLITFMESQYTDNAEPVWKGVTLSVIALLVFIMIAVFNGTCRYLEYKAYVRIYSSLLVSIYKKVQFLITLFLSPNSGSEISQLQL